MTVPLKNPRKGGWSKVVLAVMERAVGVDIRLDGGDQEFQEFTFTREWRSILIHL